MQTALRTPRSLVDPVRKVSVRAGVAGFSIGARHAVPIARDCDMPKKAASFSGCENAWRID
jgi:hypothetical protein